MIKTITTFTKTRAMHQNSTPADITGELPMAMFLHCADEYEVRQGYRDLCFGWSGCLDAPDLLPSGGCRAVFIDPAVGGMGFEGIAAVSHVRGSSKCDKSRNQGK